MKTAFLQLAKYVDHAPSADDSDLSPYINPFALTLRERLDLLKRIESTPPREGEAVPAEIFSIRFDAEVFYDKPNANQSRPTPGTLPALAKTCVGCSLVTNHDTSVGAIVGSIISATGEDGTLTLGHELTNREEMAAFVRGERKFFSIAYHYDESACSKCGEPGWEGWFGSYLDCEHEYDEDAELFQTGCRFEHNSFVGMPAVSGTNIIDHAARRSIYASCKPLNPHANRERPQKHSRKTSKKGASSMTLEELKAALKVSQDANLAMQSRLDQAAVVALATASTQDTETAALKVELKASQDAHFEAALQSAIKTLSVAPTEETFFREAYASMGLEAVTSFLSKREPAKDKPTEAAGFGQGSFGANELSAPKSGDKVAALKASGIFTTEELAAAQGKANPFKKAK